ncbi:MAG: Prephenate dehydrogenase [Alphaproteobacteria bacterium MarineAlpha3_Bin5]|nr:hypothetical protein [Magnetovibrio sp.]PPR76990.1 MAG: Prephenate dehydrogenase [Alphaproteobacteria bacterium MarineAlpha3_Bin5]
MRSLFQHVALIGIGLIGSSIARAIRKESLVSEISIASRSGKTLDKARQLQLGDNYSLDLLETVKGADLVIICTPLNTYQSIAKLIGNHLKKGTIITDVGSSKNCVHNHIVPFIPKGVHVVPGHPVAGTEKSGPENGFSELFEGRWCILTPDKNTDKNAIHQVSRFWRKIGMTVEVMSAERHDQILAITSHLPHLIAYTIVSTALNLEGHLREEIIKFSASGFRDFTRIAASDPIMWRDIFLENDEALLTSLERFTNHLTIIKQAIEEKNGEKLFNIFKKTQGQKKKVIDAQQDMPEEQKIKPQNLS